ncbi:protein-histidine N-methyltransferase [Plasmodiophora brassicae]|uniref:protein-histidine N-methyltransferase n=1 Tax=Plasmodiophora brassicae TaxID=37360 RepID=A0A0G4IV30_PLABS|nr:hypothetical protein PBRA_007085 [Plasmodiophora brassicae]SPQ95742.1 unnamed protein product [Plasmodiophora brassicae]
MASSFRFGFGDAADDDDRVEAVQGSPAAGAFVAHFEEVAPPNRTSTSAPSQVVRVASWEFRQTVFDRRQLSDEYASLKALLHASDLLPNVYEGGFKLWECAVDLVQYLQANAVDLSGMQVMDLGCGHGLPGIFALSHGAARAVFQDLNASVLQHVTIPNASANRCLRGARFLAGDWRDDRLVSAACADGQFDMVFSCDTLYSAATYPSLVRMIDRCLKRDGIAFVAAKTYYFGVGGSVQAFLDTVNQADGALHGAVIATLEDGQSNIREIVEIRKR